MEFLAIFFLVFGVIMAVLTIVMLSAIDTKLMFGPKPRPLKPQSPLQVPERPLEA